jgi:hypothetical protein
MAAFAFVKDSMITDNQANAPGNNVADTGVSAQRVGVSNSAGGVPRYAAISRSEMSTVLRDDALLVWLAGRGEGATQRVPGEERVLV